MSNVENQFVECRIKFLFPCRNLSVRLRTAKCDIFRHQEIFLPKIVYLRKNNYIIIVVIKINIIYNKGIKIEEEEKMKLERFKKNQKKRNTLLTLGLMIIILGGGYNII